LAVGVADHLIMLEYSVYSVISPEGCASILWKSADKAPEAATTLGITSERLLGLGLVDQVISEPLGGAHRDMDNMAEKVRNAIEAKLKKLENLPLDTLVEQRQQRLFNYGEFEG
ncbi:MAG: acetyl-CoA carboxylase carboxyl transferase subunit alpha, partial [Methylophaga sp.]|nr:acetyl-CoA carboxylase carboxyl transferase subunit alpha [Methylophaga sp.]